MIVECFPPLARDVRSGFRVSLRSNRSRLDSDVTISNHKLLQVKGAIGCGWGTGMGAQAWPQVGAGRAYAFGLPAEIAFLAGQGVPPAQLQEAARVSERIGVSPSRQVIASGLVTEEQFYQALAAELELRFQARSPPLQPGGDVSAILREGMAATIARPQSAVRFAVAPPPGRRCAVSSRPTLMPAGISWF